MLKWIKEFTLKVLKLTIATLLLILLINGLDVNVTFSGSKSREKTLDLLGKVKEGITVASSVNQLFR